MNRTKLRLALLAVAAVLGGASQAHAQYTYLLLEAPVTIQYSLSVPSTTTTTNSSSTVARTRVQTRPTTVPVTPVTVIEDLRESGLISTSDTENKGWSIVAVRPAPSDIYYVDARYWFYAVRRDASTGEIVERVAIPETKFSIDRDYSNYVYTERYLGAYTVDASGRSTNYVRVNYRPSFVRNGTRYDLSDPLVSGINTTGNATFAYVSVDEPVFYIAPTSMRLSGVGGLRGVSGPEAGVLGPVQGLVTFTVTIGTPRLVDASDYADVPVLNERPPITFDFGFFPVIEE